MLFHSCTKPEIGGPILSDLNILGFRFMLSAETVDEKSNETKVHITLPGLKQLCQNKMEAQIRVLL